MDNINLLLHILFGALTAGIAARFSPGMRLGVWGFLIGAITGLIGGLFFLAVFRPGDTIGSVIAAMFTALLFVFILRMAESNGITFPNRSNYTSLPGKRLARESRPDSGLFNLFDMDDEPQEHPAISMAATEPTQQFEPTKPNEATPIRYDNEIFRTGVNSLHGQSLFDTDDEVPNIPDEMATYAEITKQQALALDFSDSALEPVESEPVESEPVPYLSIDKPKPAKDVEGSYAFTEDDSMSDDTVYNKLVFDDTGVSEVGTIEDIYGANYTFDETPGIETSNDLFKSDGPEQTPNSVEPNADLLDGPDSLGVSSSIKSKQRDKPASPEPDVYDVEPQSDFPAYEYPDDLTKIRGVGKLYAQRLHAMGVHTWNQVAETEPPLLRDWVAATKTANVNEWPQLARSLAVAYDRVDASYNGPIPDDLTQIIGITKKLEHVLNRNGIVSIKQLAEADSAALIESLASVKVPAAALYDWMGQAKRKR